MYNKKIAAFMVAALNPLGITKDNGDVYEDLQLKAFAFTANVIRMLFRVWMHGQSSRYDIWLKSPPAGHVNWATLEEELTLNVLQLYQNGNAMRMEVIRCDR